MAASPNAKNSTVFSAKCPGALAKVSTLDGASNNSSMTSKNLASATGIVVAIAMMRRTTKREVKEDRVAVKEDMMID